MQKVFILLLIAIVTYSCSEAFLGKDPESTPRENFEYLWKTLDEKYSFFDYKKIDWDAIHLKYAAKITDHTNDIDLFNILFEMLNELRDAHVNLSSPFNVSRYEAVFYSSPENYDGRVVSSYYLKSDYYITGPFKHQLVGKGGAVGYIRLADFEQSISGGDVDFILARFQYLKGIIIDVRNNGGGLISNVFTIVSRFVNSKTLVYKSLVKTGPGHNDFSAPNDVYIEHQGPLKYSKPICILTNRGCYSATSFFVLAMKALPNVITVGDTTGGGLGAPTGGELPNGWAYRFSCSQTLSPSGVNFEDGIPPDRVKYLDENSLLYGHDSIIDEAIKIILAY